MKKISRFLLLMSSLLISMNSIFAQWVQTNGPYGGYIHCFAFRGRNIFVGTNGGVFLSTNNGIRWKKINSDLTNTHVGSFAISGNNIFAGTSGAGVFLSTDNGTSWSAVNSGLTDIDVYSIVKSGTNIFVGTNGKGVWKRPFF
ncbi:MAG: hypothetical protein ABSA44_03165 [Bacteroidota bacterium]|jgi:photosystem II stability/assembly factor-like uncharacterized protein